jgi:hypothetical protein
MDTEDAQVDATIGLIVPAGYALAAIDVRLDGAAIAGFETAFVGADLNNLDAKLVAENAWISEKRLATVKGVDVRAADANAMDQHKGVVGIGWERRRGVNCAEVAGLFENQGFHAGRLSIHEHGAAGRA